MQLSDMKDRGRRHHPAQQLVLLHQKLMELNQCGKLFRKQYIEQVKGLVEARQIPVWKEIAKRG